jgi:hypothetical protein
MTTGTIGGGAATLPGANKQVIFNDAGVLNGDAGLVFDKNPVFPTISVIGGQPGVHLIETDQAVDARVWRWMSIGGVLYLSAVNDNLSTATHPFNITRAGVPTLAVLAGTGSRMVQADASGVLSAAKIPGYELIDKTTFTSVGSVSFPSIFTSAYDNYRIELWVSTLNTAAAEIGARFGVSGTYDNGATDYAYQGLRVNTALSGAYWGSSGGTYMVLVPGIAAATITDASIGLDVYLPTSPASGSRVNHQWGAVHGGSDWTAGSGTGYRKLGKVHTGIQFFPSTGLFTGIAWTYGKRAA